MKINKHILLESLSVIMCLLFICSPQIKAEELAAAASDFTVDRQEIIVTDDPSDVAISTKVADPLHKEPVIINTETGNVMTESGESASMKDVFDLSGKEEKELLSAGNQENKEKIAEHLEGEGLYQVEETEEDKLKVSFPYVYKRIMVFIPEGSLKDSYGASKINYYTLSGDYILDYPSESAAMEAYEKLAAEFGKQNVIRDIPIHGTGQAFTETNAVSESWGSDMMHLDEVRDYINSNSAVTNTVTVAVLDTGINETHKIFAGRLSGEGVSYIADDNGLEDGKGHGTHVAGIVADCTPNQVKILPIKILDSKGEGTVGNFINGVNYAVDRGAKVINMSMATSIDIKESQTENSELNAIEKVLSYANNKSCVCVCAAGNDKLNLESAYYTIYPAASEYTIAVNALSDDKKIWSSGGKGSNYGNPLDFSAPGVLIRSAYTGGTDSYSSMTGTSMAAPHVSAACAILSLYNSNITCKGTIEKLKAMSEDLGDIGKDIYYGNGLIVFNDNAVPGFVHKPVSVSTTTEAAATTAATAATVNPTVTQPQSQPSVIKGRKYSSSGQTFKVTKTASSTSAGTVTFTKAKNTKSVVVPNSIKLSDNKVYKVTIVSAKAFTGKKIRTVTIGKNVKKLNKNAFASGKANKVILKTRLLKSASVKGSLKGSRIKTIQVRLGNKKINRKYIKAYKKIFTKKNAGASVLRKIN